MKKIILYFFFLVIVFLVGSRACNAGDCNANFPNPKQISYTITVDKSGQGNFSSVQSAIDFIPLNNNQWILIKISPGIYTEKITVPDGKPCLFFQGANRFSTSIEWGDHGDTTNTSYTARFFADNILVSGIAFKNTYNFYTRPPPPVQFEQAVSAIVEGDRTAFYNCGFYGIQDTLWDSSGRHYFKNCYIEGAVDFIFGNARSIYEKCIIYNNIGRYVPGLSGWITAQKKETPEQTGAFVFKHCVVKGEGKTRLGRAWGPYATVIFSNSYMTDVVANEGWDAWDFKGHESNFTFVEDNNKGAGSNSSQRETFLKKLDHFQLLKFLSISSINGDYWMQKLPLLN